MPTIVERVTDYLKNYFRASDGRYRPAPARDTSAPRGELAYADPRRLFPGAQPFATYNPSTLVGQRGLQVFDEMRRDDQVKAALAFKKFACLSTGWQVQSPEGKDPNWEPTRFARWVLQHMDPSEIGAPTLESDLYAILSGLDYGFSVTEKIWDPIEYGPWAGYVGLKALKTRAPHSITFSQDEFGNLMPDGVLQQVNSNMGGRMPRDKFVLYSYQSMFSNPYGTSDLEAAYTPWWLKYNGQKWLAMLLERYGIPPIFALYDPSKYTGPGNASLENLMKIMTNLQAATSATIPRPSSSTASQPSLEFWVPDQAGANATRIFLPSLERWDKSIARSILMPDLLGMTSDTSQGSYARAQVHFDVFLLVVESIRHDLEQIVMCHQVMKPLLDINFPSLDEYPVWTFLPLTDDLRLELLKQWNDLVTGGVVVPQENDEKHIRRLTKFPEKDPSAPLAEGPPKPLPPSPSPDEPKDDPEPPKESAEPRVNVAVHPTTVIDKGAIQVDLQPKTEVTSAPVNVSVAPPAVTVDAPITITTPSQTFGEKAFHFDIAAPPAPDVTVNAPITVESPPPAEVNVDVKPPEIAEGAIQVTVETPAVTVNTPVTVEPAVVNVPEANITIQEPPITVQTPPVTIAEGAIAAHIHVMEPTEPGETVVEKLVTHDSAGRIAKVTERRKTTKGRRAK